MQSKKDKKIKAEKEYVIIDMELGSDEGLVIDMYKQEEKEYKKEK